MIQLAPEMALAARSMVGFAIARLAEWVIMVSTYTLVGIVVASLTWLCYEQLRGIRHSPGRGREEASKLKN
jgi:hypothetical protein